MDRVPGYNPMRWNCDKLGCYNLKLRPKIEQFAECFPGKIGMSDVDGMVEINGCFLILEWKSGGGSLGTGQRIAFEQLTRLSPNITVIVVHGDPERMSVASLSVIRRGKVGRTESCNLATLKARMKAWSANCKPSCSHVVKPY